MQSPSIKANSRNATLRAINPTIYALLEPVYEKLDRYTRSTGPALVGWDQKQRRICCIGGESRTAESYVKNAPDMIIGFFDARSTFDDLQEAVCYFVTSTDVQLEAA